MIIFDKKKRKKYDEIQLTKKKMDLNIRKMTNHPPSREEISLNLEKYFNERKHGPVAPVRHVIMLHRGQHFAITLVNKLN